MRTMLTMATAAIALAAAPAAFADDGPARTSELEAAISPVLQEDAPVYAAMKSEGQQVSGLRSWFGYEPREPDPFDGFSRPITNLDFHHPFIWNEIRPVFMWHRFPETSVTGGGDLRTYALQVNVKIMPKLVFTAYKDGYTDFNPDNGSDEEGWNDIAFGLKYKVWEDVDAPAIATVGLGYETKAGAKDVLQGTGSGLFDAFGSYARSIGPLNLITTLGVKIANDSNDDANQIHWHVHGDYPMGHGIRLVGEVNGYHYYDEANRTVANFEGFDYTSFGADDVEGHNVVSAAAGFRWFATDDVSMGAAWEWSVTDREDIFQDRLTIDMVLRF